MVIIVLVTELYNEQWVVQSKFFFSTCFIPYRALTQAHSNLQYEYWFGSKNFIPDSCYLWNDCSMYESLYKWGYEEASSL